MNELQEDCTVHKMLKVIYTDTWASGLGRVQSRVYLSWSRNPALDTYLTELYSLSTKPYKIKYPRNLKTVAKTALLLSAS